MSDSRDSVPPLNPPEEPPRHRVVAAEDLFKGEKEIVIAYGAAQYRLRITKSGKLILTK